MIKGFHAVLEQTRGGEDHGGREDAAQQRRRDEAADLGREAEVALGRLLDGQRLVVERVRLDALDLPRATVDELLVRELFVHQKQVF